jgi:hypothetical protein
MQTTSDDPHGPFESECLNTQRLSSTGGALIDQLKRVVGTHVELVGARSGLPASESGLG